MAFSRHWQLRPWIVRNSSRRRFGSRRRLTQQRLARLLEPLEPRVVLAGDLRIAEVLVENDQTLQDEDGSYSDWLEIYNAGQAKVDLTGWHLTDRVNDRTQWTFDGGSLAPGQSLLVFASGKDRRDVGQELHTNFRLSAGEYLGLYQPDGRTVSDQILSLPPQYTDVSYGLEQTLVDRALVAEGTAVSAWFPASEAQDLPAATWTVANFNDAQWPAFTTGVGYDDDPTDGDFNPLINAGGNLAQAMKGRTASAYLRSEFEIAGNVLPTYETLDLNINYDDGFVAYLNGQEIARANAPDRLAWDSVATAPHGGIAAVAQYPDFSDADDRDDFTLRGNAAWDGDRLRLTPAQANQVGAGWLTKALDFGADYTFSASMKFDIHSPGGAIADADGIGGEGMTFVLQANDNNVLGSGGGGLGIDNTGSSFLAIELDSVAGGSFDPDNTLPSHLGVETSTAGNLARVAIPRFNGDAFFSGEPGPGVNYRYLWVDYAGDTQQLNVYLATTDVKPATPTLTVTVNLAELFSESPALWAGWTASTGAAFNGHDVVAWNIVTGVGEIGRDPVSLDVSQFTSALKLGTNVLAIHALNVSATDEDFLLTPRLSGQEIVLGEIKYFAEPSPDALNGAGGLPPSGPVGFSVTDSIFAAPFDVQIAAPSPAATIRYTLDGKVPDANSTVYTGPISVTATTRIRARAFEPDRDPGPITTVGYTQLDTSLSSFENNEVFNSNLPLIIFDSFGGNVDGQSTLLVPGVVTFINPGADGRANLLEKAEYTGRAGMRIRGQSSEGWPKKQYALELWQEDATDDTKVQRSYNVSDKNVSVFGLPADSDWVLNGPYSDKTQLNNFLTFLWSNQMGLYAPRARLVEVFNNRAGTLDFRTDYRGTYVMLEKIKIDQNRVDITQLEPGDNAAPEITGGYIWKKDKSGAGERPFSTPRNSEQRLVDPGDPPKGFEGEPGYVTPAQRDWLINHIKEFESVLYGPNFADPKEGYAKYIDVDSWVDTWLLVEFTKNIDGFRLSTYYHKDRDGKIKQGPAWDYNLSLGNANYLKGAYPQGWYKDAGLSADQYPYWTRLFEDPNFEQRVADRWQELRRSIWSTEKIMADIDAAVAALSDGNPKLEKPAPGEPSNPISRNFTRWTTGGYGTGFYHWPNCFFGVDDCPASPLPQSMTPNGRPNSYDDYIYIMKWFAENRAAWIDSQFIPPVTVSPEGGVVPKPTEVTIAGPAGFDLYYTLDGSDPRQPLTIREEQSVLRTGAPAQVLVPADATLLDKCDDGTFLPAPGACFMNPDYTIGSNGEVWSAATTPIGFDTEGDYAGLIRTDVGDLMRNVNGSIYVRIPFEMDEQTRAEASSFTLRMRYDDGFVAYLWAGGVTTPVEIARANAPGIARISPPINPVPFDAVATQTNPDEQAIASREFDVFRAIRNKWVRAGQNYLILQGLNESPGNNDFLLDAELIVGTTRTEVSPSVLRYQGPFSIDQNTQVIARGFNPRNPTNTQWTGRAKVTYVVDTPTLAMTEVNYNPYAPTSTELLANPNLDNDDFEFIEIRNVSPSAVNLIGASLTGVDFTFPSVSLGPGEYGVVVKDIPAFRLRYGNDPRVLGEFFSGSLDNAGERLQLLGPIGDVLIGFTYDDNALWPDRADGVGATLQLVDSAFITPEGYSKYFNWRGSTELGGSPGRAGAPPAGVVINEVLSNTNPPVRISDSIELLNVTDAPIDIGGWYLSDAGTTLLKYRIPRGTVLGPGGHILFDEADFNADPNNSLSFALNGATGDDVWLTIVDASGKLTGFADDVHFGASLNGESFGRAPNGAGRLAPMEELTLGSANSTPRVGPVVISEVQYNPDEPTDADLALDPTLTSGDLEFIEIHNPTEVAFDLTDWRIRGGAEFNFYPDQILHANETILVVRFDPIDPANTNRLAAFRLHYGLTDQVRIMGGYSQQLSGSGERLTLLRPDLTEIGPQQPPRVQEDEVVYDESLPWPPQADGTGKSLQRLQPTLFGNDAGSWIAADPNPGSVNFGAIPGDFDGDGVADAADINLLFEQMKAPVPDLRFDLTGDGLVDTNDRNAMVFDVLGTTYGDADVDGAFGSQDFVDIFQMGEYGDDIPGNSTWEEGDWNGDGDFNELDIMLAFAHGGYEELAQPALAARAIHARGVVSALEADRVLLQDTPPVETPTRRASKRDAVDVLLVLLPAELLLDEVVVARPADSRDLVFQSDDLIADELLPEDLLDSVLS